MNGRNVPTGIKIKHNPKVGDVVRLNVGRMQVFPYSWHIKYPNIKYYGIVLSIVSGCSYCMLFIRIIYPNVGFDDYNKKDKPCKIINSWEYGKEDIDKTFESIMDLPEDVRRTFTTYLI